MPDERRCTRMQVLQGKIFVWGKSSPNAAAEAAAVPVPGVPDMAMTEDIPSSTSQGVPTVALLSVGILEPKFICSL